MTGADFRGANLSRTILSGCHLQGADFSAGGSSGTDSAKLTDAKLDRALLCQANLNGCDMSGAELADADLSGADLRSAILVGAELSGATLDSVKLSNTVIELSRLSASQRTQLASTDGIVSRYFEYISAEDVDEATLRHSDWIKSDGFGGKRLDLCGFMIPYDLFIGRNLSGARIRRCSLAGANLSNCVLDMADLTYSDLSDTDLEGCSLKGATLRGVDFSRSSLRRACFNYMDFVGTKSWPANLERAILKDADLSNASFTRAIMSYSDLSGAIMDGTTFNEADLSRVKRTGEHPATIAASDRRISQRYIEPKLYVKSQHGMHYSVNWSLSGICLLYNGNSGYTVDDDIQAKVMAEGHPPARNAMFRVIKHDKQRGHVFLKIFHNTELEDYLKAAVSMPK